MLNLIKHEILSRKTAIIGWSLGLMAFGAMYIGIYPSMRDVMADFPIEDIAIYEAMGVTDMTTIEGYLGGSVFTMIPILLGVYTIMASTKTLAGEEESGTLELLLTTKLERWQIVTAKAIGLLVVPLLILLISGVANTAIFAAVRESSDASAENFFAVMVSVWPMIAAYMMIGLFLGAFMPTRRMAVIAMAVIFTAGYLGENIGNLLESLEFLKPISPFTYFDSSPAAFTDGVQLGNVFILLMVAAVFFIFASLVFQIRDVTVGMWPWQRRRIKAV